MRVSILLQITSDDGAIMAAEEVAAFEKATDRAEDVGLSLAQGKAIAPGELRAPEWPLPDGFPDPAGPIRGLSGNKLVALLAPREGLLATFANLRGGL